MSPGGSGRASNPDQVRAATDAGRTGDKVSFPDPAAAPLGTDAEVGGSAGLVQLAPAAASPRRRGNGALPVAAAVLMLAMLVAALVATASGLR